MKATRKTMTVQQAALALGVSLKRTYDLIHEGRLPATKLDGKWAVDIEAVEARIKQLGLGNA